MKLWLNGALLEPHAARIDPADRGFTLGDGVFETIRVTGGAPVSLPAHLARLRAGAACLQIGCDWTNQQLTIAIADLLRANASHQAPRKPPREAALRLTLTRGPAPRGLPPPANPTPTLLMTLADLPKPLPPARATICTVTRRNQASPLARIKSLNYLDQILARQEATEKGFDETILLNTSNHLSGATAANIFLLKNGVIVTPRVEDGALPGIMRAAIIARHDARQATLTIDDLYQADAAFCSNALGVRMIARIDHVEFSDIQRMEAILSIKEV